jgi:DNA-binding response OmpR family regulator
MPHPSKRLMSDAWYLVLASVVRQTHIGTTKKLFYGIIKRMAMSQKILVVEDDHFLSSLMKARLEKEGFEVTQAFDGEEALNLIKEIHPDLMVLDLILPKVSGFEVMESISVDPGLTGIPVMILSNLAQDTDIQKTKHLGAVEYFVKVRVSIDDLVIKIKTVLENAKNKSAGTAPVAPVTPPPTTP